MLSESPFTHGSYSRGSPPSCGVHRPSPPSGLVSHRDLVIDQEARSVTFRSHPVALRRMEYELLVCLARCPGRVFTKSELLFGVWGYKALCVDPHR